MDKEYIKKIIYSSGGVFVPEWVKETLRTDIIGSSKKHYIFRGGLLFIL